MVKKVEKKYKKNPFVIWNYRLLLNKEGKKNLK
jgi:hypothetical protein